MLVDHRIGIAYKCLFVSQKFYNQSYKPSTRSMPCWRGLIDYFVCIRRGDIGPWMRHPFSYVVAKQDHFYTHISVRPVRLIVYAESVPSCRQIKVGLVSAGLITLCLHKARCNGPESGPWPCCLVDHSWLETKHTVQHCVFAPLN